MFSKLGQIMQADTARRSGNPAADLKNFAAKGNRPLPRPTSADVAAANLQSRTEANAGKHGRLTGATPRAPAAWANTNAYVEGARQRGMTPATTPPPAAPVVPVAAAPVAPVNPPERGGPGDFAGGYGASGDGNGW